MPLQPSRNNPEAWAEIVAKLQPGAEFVGTVTIRTKFGSFVDIGNGVEGLVHISETGGPLPTGERVRVRVQAVDNESRRISLAPV